LGCFERASVGTFEASFKKKKKKKKKKKNISQRAIAYLRHLIPQRMETESFKDLSVCG